MPKGTYSGVRERSHNDKNSYGLLSRYRSMLMGLQIVFIVFFHFTADCEGADIHFDGLVEWFYTFIRSSGVDIFLLLSGMGLYFSWKKRSDYSPYIKKRLVRLLVPYFIVAIPAWGFYYLFTEQAGLTNYLSDLFFLTFFTEGTRWIWYILFAIICYIIFPFIFNVIQESMSKSDELFRTILLSSMALVALVTLKVFYDDFYSHVAIAIARLPAFFFGVLIGKKTFEDRELSLAKTAAMTAVSLFVLGPLEFAEKGTIGYFPRAIFNYSLCLLLVIFLNKASQCKSFVLRKGEKLFTEALSWLGRYTLEIYMIHLVVRKFFNLFDLNTYRYSYELLLVVITLFASILLSRLCVPIQRWILSKGFPIKTGSGN